MLLPHVWNKDEPEHVQSDFLFLIGQTESVTTILCYNHPWSPLCGLQIFGCNGLHYYLTSPGSLVQYWARIAVCVEVRMFSLCSCRFLWVHGFPPLLKNIHTGRLVMINCPCVNGALWWIDILVPSDMRIGSSSSTTLTRINRLLKMNENACALWECFEKCNIQILFSSKPRFVCLTHFKIQ